MEQYRNPESGVDRYEIAADAIVIQFKDGGVYRYDHVAPGRRHVAAMKLLARQGRGLATYINRFVRENYAEKLAAEPSGRPPWPGRRRGR